MSKFIRIENRIFITDKIEAIEAQESTQRNGYTVLTVTMDSGRKYTLCTEASVNEATQIVFDAL